MIDGVTSFGIFVQLDSLFIEGLVHVTELGADYFQYDEIKPRTARRAHRHALPADGPRDACR